MIGGNIRAITIINRNRMIKYLADQVIAMLALIILSPILLVVAGLIYYKMGRPVVFTQPRPGKNERIFKFYKFRTMTDARDTKGNLLPDEVRLTPFGQFLRKTSLDELPQLWNVLKGDMSFVGPRPLMVSYLNRYTPEQARRHEVKPGITGLAQIKGRNSISWEEKFQYDVWYVDNWSLWFDLKILLMTVLKVLRQDGINQEGYATSEEFMGQLREN
ncbi:sugar transferase [Calothrix sp. NIES-4071]|nr:sugar transferase [Calothrix sp. NIES-4071]BAZ58968.1 sugar transferase [Calothrix sp. NIES-4105]